METAAQNGWYVDPGKIASYKSRLQAKPAEGVTTTRAVDSSGVLVGSAAAQQQTGPEGPCSLGLFARMVDIGAVQRARRACQNPQAHGGAAGATCKEQSLLPIREHVGSAHMCLGSGLDNHQFVSQNMSCDEMTISTVVQLYRYTNTCNKPMTVFVKVQKNVAGMANMGKVEPGQEFVIGVFNTKPGIPTTAFTTPSIDMGCFESVVQPYDDLMCTGP